MTRRSSRRLPAVTLAVLAVAMLGAHATHRAGDAEETVAGSNYDAALAERVGADDYGMKKYVLAFLKAGPNRDHDEAEARRLQRGHLDNIQRLAREGKLVLAGPFMDDGEIRGLFIFDVRSVEEARALTESDPAIQAGRLVVELHPWYGSAGLVMLNDVHEAIARKGI